MASTSIPAAFGLVLRDLRQRAGLSQEALADAAEVDRTYISLLERGLRQPTLETLFALSEALSVSPSTMRSRTTSLTGMCRKTLEPCATEDGGTSPRRRNRRQLGANKAPSEYI